MKKIIPSIKGAREFYPEDMAVRTWLYTILREVSESYGYQEYDGPFLEPLELYAAKSGEELVKEQSFVFPDRGGDLVTLRPELTPSLARMIAQRQNQLIFPLRWWSWGPFWRYERPQKGRSREFFQWNVDLIGSDTPEADAEVVAVIATFFQKVGLSPQEVVINVNNRQLGDKLLSSLGIPPGGRPAVSRLIDRRDKITPEEWNAYALEIGLTQKQLDGLKDKFADPELWKESPELERFFTAVEAIGIRDFIKFDAYTVRGLDYYTGTVFEAMDISGDMRRSILGGGRYDNLTEAVGGDPIPAVGFAMGDVVIGLILKNLGRIPQFNPLQASVLVTVFNEEYLPASYRFAGELRKNGIYTATYPEPAKLPKQFKYANRMGMRLALVIGPDEVQNDQVAIKDLRTGEQLTLSKPESLIKIKELLENDSSS
jgi:histidyl-tRNA synthetase